MPNAVILRTPKKWKVNPIARHRITRRPGTDWGFTGKISPSVAPASPFRARPFDAVRHVEVKKVMGDWFKPLRRKLGLVSLVTALLFLGAWGRSQFQAAVIPLWNDGNIWNDLFLNATGVGF